MFDGDKLEEAMDRIVDRVDERILALDNGVESLSDDWWNNDFKGMRQTLKEMRERITEIMAELSKQDRIDRKIREQSKKWKKERRR